MKPATLRLYDREPKTGYFFIVDPRDELVRGKRDHMGRELEPHPRITSIVGRTLYRDFASARSAARKWCAKHNVNPHDTYIWTYGFTIHEGTHCVADEGE